MVLGHPPRSKQPDSCRVLTTRILHPDRTICGDTHVLNNTIIYQGQRLTILDRKKQDKPAKRAGLDAVLFLGDRGTGGLMIDDVRLTADRKVFARTTALHRTPPVEPVR